MPQQTEEGIRLQTSAQGDLRELAAQKASTIYKQIKKNAHQANQKLEVQAQEDARSTYEYVIALRQNEEDISQTEAEAEAKTASDKIMTGHLDEEEIEALAHKNAQLIFNASVAEEVKKKIKKDNNFFNDREKWFQTSFDLRDCKGLTEQYGYIQKVTNLCLVSLKYEVSKEKRKVLLLTAVLHEKGDGGLGVVTSTDNKFDEKDPRSNLGNEPYLYRNLNYSAITSLIKKSNEINLSHRDLRYADFKEAKLSTPIQF